MFRPLTISIAPSDSLNQVQTELASIAEKLTTTPADVLLEDLIGKAIAFGLKVLAALAIYCIGIWIIRKVKKILTRIFEKRGTDAIITSFVQSIASIVMTIVLIIITVGALGVDTTSLAALLAGGGMAIGMAMNGTVQNFAGGLMILVFRPFQTGDYIQFEEWEGTVSEVSIVSTKLTTTDNRIIVIPNGSISNGIINNFSHNKIRREDWIVELEYGTSIEEAKQVLSEIVSSDKRILTTETGAPTDPAIALSALGASGIQITIKAWVAKADYWPVRYDINEKIYNELPKKGIGFPYPKLDVTILNKQEKRS